MPACFMSSNKEKVTYPCYGEWALNQYYTRSSPGKSHNLPLETFERLPSYDLVLFCRKNGTYHPPADAFLILYYWKKK